MHAGREIVETCNCREVTALHWNGWGSGWWLMMLFMVLVWIAVIGGTVWLVVYLTRRAGTGSSMGSAESALDVLNKRYARGEIDKEDYERIKRDLIES